MGYNKEIVLVACDARKDSGEGALASELIHRVHLNKKFNDKVASVIYPFFRERSIGRLAYFWLWTVLIRNSFIRTKGIWFVLNFLPVWNVITFILVKKGVVIAPVTGNVNLNLRHLYCSKVRGLTLLFTRHFLVKTATFLSFFVIERRGLKVTAATPGVANALNLTQPPGPYVWTGQSVNNWLSMQELSNIWNNKREYDLIAYTNNHPLKNNLLLSETLKALSNLGLKCCVLNKGTEIQRDIFGIKYLRPQSKSDYYDMICNSNICLQLSLEGAGIFPFECSFLGLPVIGFSKTGASYLPEFTAIAGDSSELLVSSTVNTVLRKVQSDVSGNARLSLHKKCADLQLKIENHFEKELHPLMRLR